MSISSIGSGASSIWQLLSGNKSSSSSGDSSAFNVSSSDSGSSGTSGASSSSSLSAADAKVVSDLNSLLLALQADNGTSTTGASSTAASNGTGSTAATSTTDSAASSSTDTSGDVSSELVKDLKGMFGEFRHAGEHHHMEANGASDTNGSSSSTDPFAQMTSALSAYVQQLGLTSSSGNTAATASTSLSA